VFHEITKPAILKAIEEPRRLNMNLVNAQQARRILDRIVGFKVSPVLWRKVKPALSAGRVQSVAVRLIVDREREIQDFKSEAYYRVSAVFELKQADGTKSEVKAELNKRFKTRKEVTEFLEKCRTADFRVEDVQKKPLKRNPAPPFTTSTLQQEAARKLGLTVSRTMALAQRLYENGLITYMRTDSVNLSTLCINTAKEEISRLWGTEYSKPRRYHTSSKGAQEAHEAIRPTYMSNVKIDGTPQEKKLYELIWKRTAACQMAEAEIEKTTATIAISNSSEHFVADGEVVKFDGFLKVYRESFDDDDATAATDFSNVLPNMSKGDDLSRKEITATERFTSAPARYTEASLVHKLEELGIGRPSTYAPTISTIQQRGYVQKGDSKGSERTFTTDVLKGKEIKSATHKEMVGADKGKLLPTDVGVVVNDFLLKNFPSIMDYNFTAKVEQEFDEIADGKEGWLDMLKEFDKEFEPTVEKAMNANEGHRVGERELGIDPKSGHPVLVKIGRFGPMAQIGRAGDNEKPRFAKLGKGQSINSITLEEALELFKLPRTVGTYDGDDVVIGTGRFGPYVQYRGTYASLPKDQDPMTVTLETAVEVMKEKQQQAAKSTLKTFTEDPEVMVKKGRFGPYVAYKGKNYTLPKDLAAKIDELTLEDCMNVVKKSKK